MSAEISRPAADADRAEVDELEAWRGVRAEEAEELTAQGAGFLKRRSRRLLGSLLYPYRHLAWLIVAAVVVENVARLAAPELVRRGIDFGVPALSAGSAGPLLTVLAVMVAAVLCQAAGQYVFQRLSGRVAQQVLLEIRRRMFQHFQRLDVSFHDRYTSGRVISRLTNDVDAIADLFAEGVDTLVRAAFTVVGIAVILLWLDFRLGLVALFALPLLAGLLVWFSINSTRAYRRVRELTAVTIMQFVESMTGIRAVQAYRRERRNQQIFTLAATRLKDANVKAFRLMAVFMPGTRLIGNVAIGLVLLVGGLMALQGDVTVGVLAAFLLYLRMFFQPMGEISQFYNLFQAATSALEKISGVLEERPQVAESEHPTPLTEPRGRVRFDAVHFGYVAERDVLPGLELDIPAGQTVALVGTTGAGKTTIAKLIARFHDPDSGAVRLDEIDLREISDDDLRRAVVLLTQENFIFDGSIADNIEVGRPGASRAEVIAAARAVGADAFISGLSEGYDTDTGKQGSRLSAGQRQLVAFARVFLADPAVIILDEATSSLDIPAERLVQRALQTVLADRTAIIIAHRLSTVEIADRVLVLEHGRIIEDGPPELLLDADGPYARLHQAWRESLA
ncbi:ABC transporter ATP-binding protein [Enemella evansiae]|uniref:ABC transporter ATP-binding protein n=1 Tax=Enemella evansiae TaxID=2016499 RepID=UPI0010E7B310|nr:ABC transporter ATP-binding protein [Enemella evansiae]TDO92443.1 ABC-type multidrug transport system fused ATPase/permease subunit [Enemella evansiae]